MFCPHCGKTNSADHKFCRSCGLSLEKIAQTLAEQLPLAELDRHLQDRQRLVEGALTVIGGAGLTVFSIAINWAIIYKLIIVKGELAQGLMLLGLFVAALTGLVLVFYRESLIAKRKSAQPNILITNTQELLPEATFTPVTSVTDRTTDLLLAEKRVPSAEL